jgi:hypothetical protein
MITAAAADVGDADSSLSDTAGSGSVGVQGTPFGRASTSSGEAASDEAEAVPRGPDPPDPSMARLRAGEHAQDAANPRLARPVAIQDLQALAAKSMSNAPIGAAAALPAAAAAVAAAVADQTQVVGLPTLDTTDTADAFLRTAGAGMFRSNESDAGMFRSNQSNASDSAESSPDYGCWTGFLSIFSSHFGRVQMLETVDDNDHGHTSGSM